MASKLTEDLNHTTFDSNVFVDYMKDKSLIYIVFELCEYYDLFGKFGIVHECMAAFLRQALASYERTNNPYHNLLSVIDVLHNIHYFVMAGNLTKHLTDLQIMVLIFSGIIFAFSHP